MIILSSWSLKRLAKSVFAIFSSLNLSDWKYQDEPKVGIVAHDHGAFVPPHLRLHTFPTWTCGWFCG